MHKNSLHGYISYEYACVVVMQMAGTAGADELNDRQRFRGFFRTDATSEFVGPALAELARQFNWTQMAIISQEESLFTMVCDVSHHC